MEDDGGAWLPSPVALVSALFVGAHIYAIVPRKWQCIFVNFGGEWPKDDPKIYLAYDPVNLWFGGSGGELTVRVLPYQLIPHTVPLCQILFENRKAGDVGNNCLLSVDGTDFRVAKSYEKPYYSYKFKKLGFC
jgi:hypothetical protein